MRLSVNASLTRLHPILMPKKVRIPICMGQVKLGSDRARAAAKEHRGCRTHERDLTHEGSAVGGVQSGFHDVSFENLWSLSWFFLAKLLFET